MKLIIGIIGGGPRGLSAIESLCAQWAGKGSHDTLHIELFERLATPGAGQVYLQDQSEHNWLNVPERLLDLAARAPLVLQNHSLPGFPSYWEYVGFDTDSWDDNEADHYPTRAELGQYLSERFLTLAQSLIQGSLLTWHRTQVLKVVPHQSRWRITDTTDSVHNVHEVVLAAGHQATEPDEQIAEWTTHAEDTPGIHCVCDPFPAQSFQRLFQSSSISRVALRGFGLTMIDVVKNLTEGLGGTYRENSARELSLEYQPSGREPRKIIPFSLDGLPPAPKPVSAGVDAPYALSDSAQSDLAERLQNALKDSPENSFEKTIINIMASVVSAVFVALGDKARVHGNTEAELTSLIKIFLDDHQSVADNPLFDIRLPVIEALEGYLGMAYGKRPASLDYCAGQVWRHAQPTLYKTLSYAIRDRDEVSRIIALDERMKRYAFGPPPASLERLLALHQAGVVSFQFVNDPVIDTAGEKGWLIKKEGEEITVDVVIDTVLDSTSVSKVASPLFKSLIELDIIHPVDPALGVAIDKNANALLSNGRQHIPPIAILGRLAQGSLIGVDAILECFGERQDRWASGVLDRLHETGRISN